MPRADGVFISEPIQQLALEGTLAQVPFIIGMCRRCALRSVDPEAAHRRRQGRGNAVLAREFQHHVGLRLQVLLEIGMNSRLYVAEQTPSSLTTLPKCGSPELRSLISRWPLSSTHPTLLLVHPSIPATRMPSRRSTSVLLRCRETGSSTLLVAISSSRNPLSHLWRLHVNISGCK